MSSTNVSASASSSGIGFTGLLTILFIGLKLAHIIDWSWFWVLSPLFAVALLVVSILLIVVVAYIFAIAFNKLADMYYKWRRRKHS